MRRPGGRARVLGLVSVAFACADPRPQRPPDGDRSAAAGAPGFPGDLSGIGVTLEPAAPHDAVEPVSWIHLTPEGRAVPATDQIFLFVGELSAYHLDRLARRDLPQTLLDREIPAVRFPTGDGGVIVAPSAPLEPAATYTLATADLGVLATLSVRDAGRPTLQRDWPPRDVATSARRAILCGEPGTVLEVTEATVEGARGPMRVGPWPDDEAAPRCARVEVEDALAPGDVVVAPPVLGGYAVPPAPLVHADAAPLPIDCTAPEEPLGPGCLRVLDDRLALRGPGPASHWALSPGGGGGPLLVGETLVVPGLEPEAAFAFRARITLSDGTLIEVERATVTGPAEPHVVVNEVLANAVGAEPAGEWVELINDGVTAVDLAGWTLADLGEETALPAVVLDPGQFAVVVSERFAPDPEVDVAPPADALLIRVPTLGQSGLANAGELLRLRSPDGLVRSRFPALAAPGAGVSVARRAPWLADDVAAAFGRHAPPGASPGWPNELAE